MMPGVGTTAQAQVPFGKPEKINEQWEFYLGDNPAGNTKWRTLDLPHDWSVEGILNPRWLPAPAILSDNLLTCRIEGSGKLLGMEAGDNTDMGNYRDNRQRVFMGRMIAYVEASGEGDIQVRFSSPWLKTETVTIQAK
jgi:hypothetical protein